MGLSNKSLIAIVGNPNTGKTTLFNGLCRTRQKTANYSGTTTEKKIGQAVIDKKNIQIIDLPGLYSLQSKSLDPLDEKIAKNTLLGKIDELKKPDLLLFTLDASNLRRNLFLFSQITELNIPIIIALTMYDQAIASNIGIDVEELKKELGVDIVPVVAYKEKDVKKLELAIKKSLEQKNFATPFNSDNLEEEKLLSTVYTQISKNDDISRFQVREYLSHPDQSLIEEEPKLKEVLTKAHTEYSKILKTNMALSSLSRYRWIDKKIKRVLDPKTEKQNKRNERLDTILTHPILGILIFLVLLYFIFESMYTWSGPIMDSIDMSFGWLGESLGSHFGGNEILKSLVQDGIIAGVGAVLIFLPQIVILFLFIALLEDSGYLVRVAFLADRLLAWSGLNGRSFIPLLSSFACAIPGILAARVIPDSRVRNITILVAPLMSCSARLPIYVLFIGAIIEPYYGASLAVLCLFFMHALGAIIALPLSWSIQKFMSNKVPRTPFVMEFPAYKRPRLKNVLIRVWNATKNFVTKAGTIIFIFSIIIWALAYFPRSEKVATEALALQNNAIPKIENIKENEDESSQLANSYLGSFGKIIAPVFTPLGFDWKITVGIISAFPARELLLSALGIIYRIDDMSSENQNLRNRLQLERRANGKPVYTPLLAISLMVFFALCSQCMGTLAVIKKELGKWSWAIVVFVYMTGLAYLFSFLTYQGGLLLGFE